MTKITPDTIKQTLVKFGDLYSPTKRMEGRAKEVQAVWCEVFDGCRADEWAVAVKRLIATKSTGFFPVPGEMTEALSWAKDKLRLTATKVEKHGRTQTEAEVRENLQKLKELI